MKPEQRRLRRKVRSYERTIARTQRRLVQAIRDASDAGLSQRQIGAAIGRSQPEVSRMLRFQGSGPLAHQLRSTRQQVLRVLAEAGAGQPRVVGPLATGEGKPSSVDLLIAVDSPLEPARLRDLERQVAQVVGADVQLKQEPALDPDTRARLDSEAIRL